MVTESLIITRILLDWGADANFASSYDGTTALMC